ncbi:hypothetical protein TEU_02980 [Thermococcus eurythermalis]|uniref:Uncharacterized protein n=1 Tax=Thermococcus eurythermalis TaxID=1505907 RepID=A0A097QSF7_9EURY|nr:hypothetical protein [Thermococcus eurythermalis]AIU69389.1 hypothetical protein TEU_02980 [Thermococcus eurythermalis]
MSEVVWRGAYPVFTLESLKLKWNVFLLYAMGLALYPLLDDARLVLPYFVAGFLFVAFSGDFWETAQVFLSKPYRRLHLFFELFLSNLLIVFLMIAPFALFDVRSVVFALFAIPFLPLGYLTSLAIKSPKKAMTAGIVIFLLLTFVPPGIVQLKAQEKAQSALEIKSLEDYEANKEEYGRLVTELERRYSNYAFFSPGAQLELFARDVETDDREDAFLRLSITLATFLALTSLALFLFLRFEPGTVIKPSLPALYIPSLPWWIGKELAGLWASRTFQALLVLLILPVDGTLKSFALLFLLPLASLEVLSENPVLILSKPVGRSYLLRRFLITSLLFGISIPVCRFSFGVAFFLASLTFFIGLFTRKGALILIPVLALLFAPAISSAEASLVLMVLSAIPLILSAFRLSRMDFSAWGGVG